MKLHVNCRPLWFSTVLFGALLVWLLTINAFAALAEDHDADGGTIPPLQNFTKTVYSVAGIQDGARTGEEVVYTISMHNTISESYTARIGVTDTVPVGLSVLTDTIVTSEGNTQFFVIDGASFITWTIDVEYGASYTLTYSADAPTNTMTLTNTSVLYEISNRYALPTEMTKTAQAVLTVRQWEVYLPLIRRDEPPPKPQLPQFDHYNFEQNTKLKDGWEQLVDGKSGNLIYSAQQTNLVMIDGGSYVAWMGGAPGENKLSQTITLPRGYSDLRIRYRYWIYSEESDCDNGDKVEVQVNEVPQVIETEGAIPHQLCSAGRTSGWKLAKTTNNLANLGGEPITLTFLTCLNKSRNSNFFIDVVQLCSSDADAPMGTLRCDDLSKP